MKRLVWIIALLLASWCSGAALAASGDQVTVDIGVKIAVFVRLTISPNTITFPSANPDTMATIPANQNPVQVECRIIGFGHSDLYLYAMANSDLVSGGDRIPIGRVSWTATNPGFLANTLSTTPVLAGSWGATGSKTYSGSFSYFLQNSWDYPTGNYTATVTYTLTSP